MHANHSSDETARWLASPGSNPDHVVRLYINQVYECLSDRRRSKLVLVLPSASRSSCSIFASNKYVRPDLILRRRNVRWLAALDTNSIGWLARYQPGICTPIIAAAEPRPVLAATEPIRTSSLFLVSMAETGIFSIICTAVGMSGGVLFRFCCPGISSLRNGNASALTKRAGEMVLSTGAGSAAKWKSKSLSGEGEFGVDST